MTRRITLAIVVALATLLLSAGLAAAQEPPDAESGTRLEPGVNLVGWVGEPTPVSQLFQQIPQLEAIWAWDAELRDWIVAAPGAPEWLGGLRRVTAGMGLRMQLGGDQSYFWRRSTEPTRELVKLRTGWNLVAWSGADGAAIGDVVKGIGWSLRTVRRWDAANQQWDIWTSPERSAQVIANTGADQETDDDAEMPGIRRGAALWIEVARAVNWLQPTEILPRLVFPGGASDALQARVREDLQATLAFFRDQYGIQADPNFTVYAAKDADALIQARIDDGAKIDSAAAASIRALWHRAGGWAGSNVVVKQSSWPEDLSADEIAWARYTVTHEYFHILQAQLSDGSAGQWLVESTTNSRAGLVDQQPRASQWLVEGTASWIDSEHAVFDGKQTRDDLRGGLLSAITNDTPTLRSTESDNARWHYTLGQLATDQLTATGGSDSLVEFWRALASTEIGPHQRWTSTLDWRSALRQVFGQPVSEFYTDFNAWQREQAAANPTAANSYDGGWIRGQVRGEDGAPVAGVFVNAIRVEGETSVGWNQRAETAADGTFAVRAHEDGDYRISVDIADDCTIYYSDGELINYLAEAQPVAVAGADVRDIDVQLPANVCRWQIRGRVVGPDGEPLADISVAGCKPATISCTRVERTARDGSFAVRVPTSGEYHLGLGLSTGCEVYYSSKGPTFDQDRASSIMVGTADVSGVSIEVQWGMCAHLIKGSIRQADGQPLAGIWAVAWLEADGDSAPTWRGTDNDGTLTITVPTPGRYSVQFNPHGCSFYFGAGGLTPTFSERSIVRVEGRDLLLGDRQLPNGVCQHQITGRAVDSDGAPLSLKSMSVRGPRGSALGQTNVDGSFDILVPSDGVYSFGLQLREQPYCWYNFHGGALGSPNNPVRVSGADATGIILRPPGTIEELCE